MLTIKKKKGTDFKILNITDTHLVTVDWENPVLRDTFIATIDELVDATKPDLITMDYANEDLTKYVTIGEYKGFSAEVEMYDLDDEYIEKQLNDLLLEYAVNEQITDRKTADGDAIIVDFGVRLTEFPSRAALPQTHRSKSRRTADISPASLRE